MSDIINETTIERAKGWITGGEKPNVMEFIRDDRLVATVFFPELNREAFHQGFQFLLPMLQADEASLWLDARMKVMDKEPRDQPYERGEIGDDPSNQEVLVITHAKRGAGVDIIGLPYLRDDEGKVVAWDDDSFDGTSLSPFADSAHEGLAMESSAIESILQTSSAFGLSPEEARVRADCAVLKMFMTTFNCMLALGAYEDEDLNQHLSASFGHEGFEIHDVERN